MRKPNIIIIIIIDSELVFSFEPQRIIPTESIHHRPSIQDAKLLVATRKTQRKIHEYRICFTKLKIQLNVIRYHDANPQANTRYMHSAFIIYLLIIILRWIYHVNGIWRNFWYTQESSVKQEKRYCARCFVIFSSCAPPQSTTSNWAASSAKSHASPSSQTQTGDTSSTTKRKWDYWDHVFAEMIFSFKSFKSISIIVTNCLQSTRLEGDMQFQLIASTKSTLSSEEIHLQKLPKLQ